MKDKVCFVTGGNGQDSSYLIEHLVRMGCKVHAMVRRHSESEAQTSRISHLLDIVETHYGDVTDQTSIEHLLTTIKPDYIFNTAGQSHVRVSFDIPQFTFQTNAVGVLNLLEAYKRIVPEARFYQCSSSEMFGLTIDEDGRQRETTIMNPTSVYGVSKVAAYNLVRHYRRAYGLHACNGILFNHSSPRRGENFVEQKIVKGAVSIKLGLQDKLELGNLDSFRDIGHSKDYTRAMILIANHTEADDFVVATGMAYSIRGICETVFSYLDLDYHDYVVQNPKFMRPEELPYLCGDSYKIRKTLGWSETYSFKEIMEEMTNHWLLKLSK